MKYTYSGKEKLKSKKLIEKLFDEGRSLNEFPLRLVYLSVNHREDVRIKVAVSVSKRNFKKAVDRNRIKRLLREAYRLNNRKYFNNITTQYALMILYIGNEVQSFEHIDNAMKKLLLNFKTVVKDN
jgi:ribonuclease P protein component